MFDRFTPYLTFIYLLFFDCAMAYRGSEFAYEYHGLIGAIFSAILIFSFLVYCELLLLKSILGFLSFIFWCVIAYCGGIWGYGYFGWVGAICGTISGVVLIKFFLCLTSPPDYLPNCECGKSLDDMDSDNMCSCGKKYIRQGNKWLEIMPDGNFRPFMKVRRLKWVPDNEHSVR